MTTSFSSWWPGRRQSSARLFVAWQALDLLDSVSSILRIDHVRCGEAVHFETLEDRRLFASATGLSATYFDDVNFGGASAARTDAAVNFNWSTGKPASGIHADTYSVRWTGRLKALSTATFRLFLLSESAVRLWIGDRLIVDGWTS